MRGSATLHKIFETDSSFHVKWCTGARVYFLFFKRIMQTLAEFSFCQGAGEYAIILWGLDAFLALPNLLRYQVLRRSATREITCIYHVYIPSLKIL